MAGVALTCLRCGTVVVTATQIRLCPVCLLESALGAGLPIDAEAVPPAPAVPITNTSPHRLPEPPAQLRYFGDYELVGELARGGMGIVYLGRQTSLDRLVAVKFLLYGGFSSPAYVERFRTEAAAAARLQHPGIVAIYEIGQHEGHHFFSMEYVPGENLAQHAARQPPTPLQATAIVQKVAEAVHFAHTQGILHRDLKPANILLDKSGRVRVTDFGLAKRLDRNSELTSTGEVIGSPSFMAPEQVLGHSNEVGPSADIYGLGAMLYYLLTGRPPFQAATIPTTLELVVRADPVSPRKLNPSVPRDLETICLKCLAKSPGARYLTAESLAADLGRFLRDEPIRARPVGKMERVWLWTKRRPALAGLIGASIILVLTLILGGWAYGRQREQARGQERALRAEGDRKTYALSLNLAERARSEGDFQQADQLLAGVVPRPGEPDLRGFEWYHLQHELRGREERILLTGTNEVLGLAANSQGDRLAALFARELRLFSIQEGATLGIWPIGEEVAPRALVFVGGGSAVVLGALSGAILYQEGQAPRTLLTEPANVLAVSDDGLQLAFSHSDPSADMESEVGFGVLNLKTDRIQERQKRDGGPGLAWVNSEVGGADLLILGSRSQLTQWHPGRAAVAIWPRSHFTDFATFSPDRKRVVYDDIRGFLVWSATSNLDLVESAIATLKRERMPWSITRPVVSYRADGARAALKNGADRRIAVCDTTSGIILDRYPGHRGEITGLAFLGTSATLASSSRDGSIRLWNTAKSPGNYRVTNDLGRFYLPAPFFSSDSSQVALVNIYRSPRAGFNVVIPSKQEIVLKGDGVPLSFFADDSRLLLWQRSGRLSTWNLQTHTADISLDILGLQKEDWPHLSGNGQFLFGEEKGSVINSYDLQNNSARICIGTNLAFVTPISFGSGFAALSDHGVYLWDSPNERWRSVLNRDARALTFSRDGAILAAGDIGGTVALVDARPSSLVPTGQERAARNG